MVAIIQANGLAHCYLLRGDGGLIFCADKLAVEHWLEAVCLLYRLMRKDWWLSPFSACLSLSYFFAFCPALPPPFTPPQPVWVAMTMVRRYGNGESWQVGVKRDTAIWATQATYSRYRKQEKERGGDVEGKMVLVVVKYRRGDRKRDEGEDNWHLKRGSVVPFEVERIWEHRTHWNILSSNIRQELLLHFHSSVLSCKPSRTFLRLLLWPSIMKQNQNYKKILS